MFSKVESGGNDLGFWTGVFPQEPIIILGDTLIWSFLSAENNISNACSALVVQSNP